MRRVPLDQADRRVLLSAIILVLAFLLACATIGAGLGLGVRAYWLMAGW